MSGGSHRRSDDDRKRFTYNEKDSDELVKTWRAAVQVKLQMIEKGERQQAVCKPSPEVREDDLVQDTTEFEESTRHC